MLYNLCPNQQVLTWPVMLHPLLATHLFGHLWLRFLLQHCFYMWCGEDCVKLVLPKFSNVVWSFIIQTY